MLSEDNYATWSHAVIMALILKNKEGFIDGSIVKLTVNDLLYGTWRRYNHVVASWIINSVPKEFYPSVMHKESARQIWIELRDRYNQGNRNQIYEIKKQITSILKRIILSIHLLINLKACGRNWTIIGQKLVVTITDLKTKSCNS